MISSNDPWSEFRKDNGEFRKWLHIWSYTGAYMGTDPSLHFPYPALPWVIREPLSGDLLMAMQNLGMIERWPGEWPRFDFRYIQRKHLPVYAMVLPTASIGHVVRHLRKVELQCASHAEYMERLNRRYVLFPKPKENVNESSRSTKDRFPLI